MQDLLKANLPQIEEWVLFSGVLWRLSKKAAQLPGLRDHGSSQGEQTNMQQGLR